MFKRILVPVDGSTSANDGLREAIRLARAGSGIIRLMHVVERLSLDQGLQPALISVDILRQMQVAGRSVLRVAEATVKDAHVRVQVVQRKPRRGSTAREIVREGQRWRADLIVMGSHGLRAGSMLPGTTAQNVIRSALTPVLLVEGPVTSRFGRGQRHRREAAYQRVLVPLDGSRPAAAGLREVIKCAAGMPNCVVRLMHVLEPHPILQGMDLPIAETWRRNRIEHGESLLRNAKEALQQSDIRVETVFHRHRQQPAADAIASEIRTWKPDLVVMGTHGRRGVARAVMGSDAEAVVRSCSVPVLLVRARQSNTSSTL